jgi:hypothetical protein
MSMSIKRTARGQGRGECQSTMASLSSSATAVNIVGTNMVTMMLGVAVLVIVSTVTCLVDAYTFDPLNNAWRPSATTGRDARTKTSSYPSSNSAASSAYYGQQQQGPATAWRESPSSTERDLKSLLQIEYNQETGELSLVDPNGIVSPEDYKTLMQTLTGRRPSGSVGNAGPHLNDNDDLPLVNHDDLEDDDVIDAVIEVVPSDEVAEEVAGSTNAHQQTTRQSTGYQNTPYQPQHQQPQHYTNVQGQNQQQGYYQHHVATVQQQSQQAPYQYQAPPQQQQHTRTTAVPGQPLYQLQLLQEQERIMQATHDATMQQFQQQYQQQQPTDQMVSGYAENTEPLTDMTPNSGGWGFDCRRKTWMG